MTTRRKFFEQATVASISLGPGACRVATAADAPGGPWTLEVLGDIHFDKLSHHDMDWVAREKPDSIRQIESYSETTEKNYPKLLQKLKMEVAADSTCQSVIQVGDLVQGLCGSEPLARIQCEEAIASLRDLDLGIPTWITKGNHDITGPGALEAYEKFVVPFCGASDAPKPSPNPSQFTREQNGWLVVMYDGYANGSLDWLENILANREPGRLIFVVHQPVVPYNARSAWGVYVKASQSEKRERLMRLLGKHRAVVLSGHLHKHSFVERDTAEGPFTQLAVCSVANRLDGEARDLITGIENYTPDLVDLEPNHSPKTIDARRAILAAEKPYIRRFDYGAFWGRVKLHISGDKIEAGIYQMLSDEPWKTIDLAPGQA